MSKKQRQQIANALGHLQRARTYLLKADTVICRRASFASTVLHLTRADGLTLYPVEKEYGSDLTGLDMGIDALERVLNPPILATME